ncbi:MAG: phosphoesterase [Fibrobacter sp.]|nr:phosphoesterase [Fibrobacter sp.]
MAIFFTSDTHFGHKNIIKYCKRPFSSVEEMDDALIENWNKKISLRGNTVYHLGDFANAHRAEKVLEYRKRLNGRIILIEGTHDNFDDKKACGFTHMTPLLPIKHEGVSITLCHYALRVWPKSHFDAWHCYGHSHGRLEPIGKSWDVGVDNNNYSPISFEELSTIMADRPHNPNLIKVKTE